MPHSAHRVHLGFGAVALAVSSIVAVSLVHGAGQESVPAVPPVPPPSPASPTEGTTVGSAFTYQGELSSGGVPADGSFEIGFTLWDAEAGGVTVGGPLAFPSVPVAGGRFMVELDFGVDALGAGPRWLEITVEGFTLSPRQAITPAPFAVRTRGIDVNDAGNVGIGVTASGGSSRLRVWNTEGVGAAIEAFSPGGSAVQAISDNTGNPAVFASNQDTEGTALFATVGGGQRVGQLGTPTVAVRGQAFDTANDWAAFFSGRSYLGERAFLGRTDPITSAEYFGVRAIVEGTNYGGMYVSTDGPDTRPFYGYAPGGVAQAWTTFDGADDTWKVFVNGVPRLLVNQENVRTVQGVPMPVATALVNNLGGIITGTAGLSVSYSGAPLHEYTVSVDGVDLQAAVVQVTRAFSTGGNLIPLHGDTSAGEQRVRFTNLSGGWSPSAFSIVIWRP